MQKKAQPELDIESLRAIQSAADFYAYKGRICIAIGSKDPDFARNLSLNTSIMDFFLKKDEILAKLEGVG